MRQLTAEIDRSTGSSKAGSYSALSGFHYQNGYRLSATDLGNQGVKIELVHEKDIAGAIILPPGKVGECGRWLLETLGQDKHGLPKELFEILQRLSKQKGGELILQRGDKKTIKDTIRILRS